MFFMELLLQLASASPRLARAFGEKWILAWLIDRAVDAIRERFGGQVVDYGSALRAVRSVPDEFRRLAEKEL
jgi:hypothetical protein